MNLQQFREQARQAQEEDLGCCHFCGRAPAEFNNIFYIEADGRETVYPHCRRCYFLSVFGKRLDEPDAIDEMVMQMARVQCSRIRRFLGSRYLPDPFPELTEKYGAIEVLE